MWAYKLKDHECWNYLNKYDLFQIKIHRKKDPTYFCNPKLELLQNLGV